MHKTTARRMIFIAMLIIFNLAALWSCENKDKKKADEVAWLRLVYLWVNLPDDLSEACQSAKGSALNCMGSAGGTALQEQYIITMEQLYQIVVSPPREATQLCDSLINSPDFPIPGGSGEMSYSTGAKICFFSCEGEFWETAINSAQCNLAELSNLQPGASETYSQCIEECLIQGSIIP